MIYAIRAGDTEFVKIGKANSVQRRYNEIQTHSPYLLEILAVARWDDRCERIIHKHLEPHWERGEWFRLTPETWQVVRWMQAEQWDNTALAAIRNDPLEQKAEAKNTKRTEWRKASNKQPTIKSAAQIRRAQRAAYWKTREQASAI